MPAFLPPLLFGAAAVYGIILVANIFFQNGNPQFDMPQSGGSPRRNEARAWDNSEDIQFEDAVNPRVYERKGKLGGKTKVVAADYASEIRMPVNKSSVSIPMATGQEGSSKNSRAAQRPDLQDGEWEYNVEIKERPSRNPFKKGQVLSHKVNLRGRDARDESGPTHEAPPAYSEGREKAKW